MSEQNSDGPVTRGISAAALPAVTTGPVIQALVETVDPTLVAGTSSPLRLNAARELMTVVGSSPGNASPVLTAGSTVVATGIVLGALAGQVIGAYTVRETAGAAATFNLHNGVSNAGPVIGFVGLFANQRIGGDWGGRCVDISNGLFLDIISGAIAFVPMTAVVT